MTNVLIASFILTFVNLAHAAGLEARRLLLLSPNGNTNHVVAEVHINGRWVVVDPSFRVVLKDAFGHWLTREQLAEPDTFRVATGDLPTTIPVTLTPAPSTFI